MSSYIPYKQKKQGISIRAKSRLFLIVILILGVFSSYVSLPSEFKTPFGLITVPKSGIFEQWYTHLGLDLQGGTHLVYEADVTGVELAERGSALEGARDVIERRVNALGVAEPIVQTARKNDNYRLVVELAGVTDVNEAIQVIGETPLLEFKEVVESAPDSATPSPEEITEVQNSNEEKRKLAEVLITRLKTGEAFEDLARQYSEDPANKDSGGDLGWVKRGLFTAEFEKAVFDDLQAGELRQTPLFTEFGYHIIKKIDERTAEDGEPEVRSSHILLRTRVVGESAGITDWVATPLSGKQLKRAQVVFEPQTNTPQVSLTFDSDGAKLFEDITRRNIGKPVGIFLDGSVISAPTVQTAISGGEAVITGNFTLAEAKVLAQRLNAGALPIPIHLASQQTIDATLGFDSLYSSLNAALLGLVLVAIFMIIYYRLPGMLSVLALLIYAVVTLALFNMIPVTLTLAGVAGFILSVGMAVDANILIFERIKEELSRGKSYIEAVEEGFVRAWPSIRDSNISSLMTCVILYWLGTSVVRGFAVTLGIGILVSMFSAISVSRTFLRVVAGWKAFQKLWLFGFKKHKHA